MFARHSDLRSLHAPKPEADRFAPEEQEAATPIQLVLRQKWPILGFAVLVTALVAVVVLQLPPRYTSVASVAVDTRQPRVLGAENIVSSQPLETNMLRTMMESFNSAEMAVEVVRRLNLQRKPEFCEGMAPKPSWDERLAGVANLLRGEKPVQASVTCPVSVEAAALYLLGRVNAFNDNRSYVIRIGVEVKDPGLAADTANAYAEVFIARRRSLGQRLAEEANTALQANAGQLRERMKAAADALERFRTEHGLASLREGTPLAQTVAELNSQTSTVNGELIQKESMVRQLHQLAASNGSASSSTLALASPLIQRLLERQAQLAATQSQLRSSLGNMHPDVQAVGAQLGRLSQQIRFEIGKVVEAATGEVAALRTHQASLVQTLRELQGRLGEQANAESRLRELERDANFTRDLYQSSLTRLTEINVERGFQGADARLAAEALPPDLPSFPRFNMLVAGAFVASIGAGSALTLLRSLTSGVLRSSNDLERQLGLRMLGLFPRPAQHHMAPHDVVLDQPWSMEAEATHATLATLIGPYLERNGPMGRVVMVTSALPGEGKTSLSLALGRTAVQSGLSAIVIDCDLRRPSVEGMVGPAQNEERRQALAENGIAALFDRPDLDNRSNLLVMPVRGTVQNPRSALTLSGLPQVLRRLRMHYDIIILDTPPTLAVADSCNLGPLADDAVVVVNWRHTPRAAVADSVKALRRSGVNLAGAVFSKVDLRRYARTDAEGHRYARAYRQYYHQGPPPARQ